MTELREAGLIKYQDKLGGSMQTCTLTMEAHKRLAELEKASTTSSRAFVAMWFHDSMNDVWERGFKKAIEDAGYEPVRIDKLEHLIVKSMMRSFPRYARLTFCCGRFHTSPVVMVLVVVSTV